MFLLILRLTRRSLSWFAGEATQSRPAAIALAVMPVKIMLGSAAVLVAYDFIRFV